MTAIVDLVGIEVEHLLGEASGPLVKVRAIGEGEILLGMISPADARQIAGHLMESAARAEYEADFFTEATNRGLSDSELAALFDMVRTGEMRRHTGGER